MKKIIVLAVLSLVLFFSSISFAAPHVTVNERSFSVVYQNAEYVAYFDRTNNLLDVEETGVCYVSSPNYVVAIFDYWYKEGEVLRVHGFSDFLLGPDKITQIIYGIELNEK